MPSTINKALADNKKGFYVGHRLILPFRCQIVKIIVEKEVFTEMVGSDDVKINQDPKNTSVYVRFIGKLDNYIGTYKTVKLIIAEWDADLTDMSNHIKIVCEMQEKHVFNIHVPSDDMLFIE